MSACSSMIDRVPGEAWHRQSAQKGSRCRAFGRDRPALPAARARASLRMKVSSIRAASASLRAATCGQAPIAASVWAVSRSFFRSLLRVSRVTPGREREGKLRLVGEARAWPTAERGDRIPDALPRSRLVEEGEAIHASRRRARRGPQERAERACAPPAAGAEEAEIEVGVLAAGELDDTERTATAPNKRQQGQRRAARIARHDDERLSAWSRTPTVENHASANRRPDTARRSRSLPARSSPDAPPRARRRRQRMRSRPRRRWAACSAREAPRSVSAAGNGRTRWRAEATVAKNPQRSVSRRLGDKSVNRFETTAR